MEKTLLSIGWLIATIVFIGVHHFYNWVVREVNKNDNNPVQLPIALLYILVNILYFVFTYNVFKII